MAAGHKDLLTWNSPYVHHWTFSLKTNPVGNRRMINTPQSFCSVLWFKPSWKLSPMQPSSFIPSLIPSVTQIKGRIYELTFYWKQTVASTILLTTICKREWSHTKCPLRELMWQNHSWRLCITLFITCFPRNETKCPLCSTFLFHLKSCLLLVRKETPLPLPISTPNRRCTW